MLSSNYVPNGQDSPDPGPCWVSVVNESNFEVVRAYGRSADEAVSNARAIVKSADVILLLKAHCAEAEKMLRFAASILKNTHPMPTPHFKLVAAADKLSKSQKL